MAKTLSESTAKLVSASPFSRLGEAWEFRHALEQARAYVQEQDDWSAKADAVGVDKNGLIPATRSTVGDSWCRAERSGSSEHALLHNSRLGSPCSTH